MLRSPALPSGAGPFRSIAGAAALVLVLAAAGCNDEEVPIAPPADEGVPADAVSEAVATIDLARFATRTIVADWEKSQRLDATWHYDADAMAWNRSDGGRQTTYVGNGSGGSTEVRFEYQIDMIVHLQRLGSPTAGLLQADRARFDLTIRRRHYALDPGWPLKNPYDVTSVFATEFRLEDGAPDTILSCGQLTGWLQREDEGITTLLRFDGPAEIQFDFPGHVVPCPSERMSASFDIRNDKGVLLDRYAGSFQARAGESLFKGRLESEKGPGAFGINEDRGCP